MSNFTYFQNPVYLHHFCVFEIFVRPTKRIKRSLFHILNGYAHICLFNRNVSWTVEQSGCIFSVAIAGHCWHCSPRLGDWQWIFACFCRLSTNHTYLTCRNFVCQHSVMAETTVKRRVFVFIVFNLQNLRRRYF